MTNRIGIFLFVKNEVDFIEKWLAHNLQIADEVVAIDNGSTDGTLDILKKYESGIRLVEDKSNFGAKGRTCLEWIKRSETNLAIPLDADELIVLDDGTSPKGDPKRAREYLAGLNVEAGDKFMVRNTYMRHPEEHGWWGASKSNKRFFAKEGLIGLDCGFHTGRTEKGGRPKASNLSYLHYHFRNEEAWLKSTEQKLKARLGRRWNDLEFLKSYNGPSYHSARELLIYKETGIWHRVAKQRFDESLGR